MARRRLRCMLLLCHCTMDWQLAPQALSLPLLLASCTHPLLDGLTFHHADQPAFAFHSRQFRCCAWLHLPLPGPLKSLIIWQHGDCALRGITLDITGPPNGLTSIHVNRASAAPVHVVVRCDSCRLNHHWLFISFSDW